MDGSAAHLLDSPLTASERASLNALGGIVVRLGALVDGETDALRDNRPIDLGAINQGKRQGLLELSRLVPQLTANLLRGAGGAHLVALSEKLERNRCALDVQVRAVREVSDIIARTLKESESDGTYSGQTGRS